METNKKQLTSPNLIGRDDLMVWLEQIVFPTNHQQRQGQCPLILLHGVPGVGKTAACRSFLRAQLAENPNSKPVFAFDWKGGPHGQSAHRFSKLLFEMGVTNLTIGQSDKNLVYVDIQAGSTRASPVHSNTVLPDQTYRADGAPAELNVSRQVFTDDEQSALAQEFVDCLIAWMRPISLSHTVTTLGKLVFFFDDFQDYHGTVRQWVGRYMYPAIMAVQGLPGCAYLFTGNRPWSQTSFVDSWNVLPGSLKEYKLGPLSANDCKQWLNAAGLKEEYLEVLLEETEGIPGRIVELLESEDSLDVLDKGLPEGGPLARFDARERAWLHAASMNAVLSFESFELLIGREEAGRAIDWLRRHSDICRVIQSEGRSGSIRVDPEIRIQVLQRARRKIPMRHQEFDTRLGLLKSFCEKVPSEEHRRFLQMLAPIDPLNEEAIRFVYGEA